MFNSSSYLLRMDCVLLLLLLSVKDLDSKLDTRLCSDQYKGEQDSHCPSRGNTSIDTAAKPHSLP